MMTTATYNYKPYVRWKMFRENRVYKEGQIGGSLPMCRFDAEPDNYLQ